MGNRRDYLIKNIVEICQRLDTKGWVANHDGNVSVRYEDTLLATPTATSKADIVPEMIITLDKTGKKTAGIGKPFSEINLHLIAYEVREEITAVVHAHPPFAMARGLVGGDFEIVVPEAMVSIGDVIPTAPYALPGSTEHKKIVTDALCRSDVFMMTGNGVLSVGRDVKEAYLRMELLEHLLRIDYYARSMGSIKTIPPEDKKKLLEKRAAIGLGPQNIEAPLAAPSNRPKGEEDAASALIRELVAGELKKVLTDKK